MEKVNKYSAIFMGSQMLFITNVSQLRNSNAEANTTLVSKGNYISTDVVSFKDL